MPTISQVISREILDSRGNPTVEVDIVLDDGTSARAAVPSGASTGEHEAVELRDGQDRYNGKGVRRAVEAVRTELASAVVGCDVHDQRRIDRILIDTDATADKSRLGANSLLGVSLAVARAGAAAVSMDLYRYIGGSNAHVLPVPLMNIVNGGAHADTGGDVQEFMIVPLAADSFDEALRWGTEIYHALKSVLKNKGLSTGLGDEGGFAPDVADTRQALDLITIAVDTAGFGLGDHVALALDVAASEFFTDGAGYRFEGKDRSTSDMIGFYRELIRNYPVVSIEDPLSENDWTGWVSLTEDIGDAVQLVGDDLFVTNPTQIQDGIDLGAANALLVKFNQIGTLTETLDAIDLAHRAGYKTMISHRSGETEDTTIADIAVAVGSGQIKTGAPARSERVAKYNQLLRIEQLLGKSAHYAGRTAFPRYALPH